VSAFQLACASSYRGQRGSEESRERRLSAVEAAGGVVDEPDGAGGVDDEAVASEALLSCL